MPFEVTETLASDGYTFLADADAGAIADGGIKAKGGTLIHRDSLELDSTAMRPLAESFEQLFALKHTVIPHLKDVPYVLEDEPVVCAWYPTARTVALWNLANKPREFTVAYNQQRYSAKASSLGMVLLENVG